MRKTLTFFLGGVLMLSALGGCDDRDGGKPRARAAHHVSILPTARFGAGWSNVADGRTSIWRFAEQPDSPAPPDSLDSIRAALAANMLPPRDSVRVAELIGRVARAVPPEAPAPAGTPPGPDARNEQSEAMVTTSPWNDHTWLLWVSVSGLDRLGRRVVSIDFNPASVTSFRPLGDVAALPGPQGADGRAQALYELSPAPDGPQSPGVVYAVLHVGGGGGPMLDRPIGPGNFIDSIDNAPDVVRFAAAVAEFAELLRGDPAVRDLSCADVIAQAESADKPDPDGVRAETIGLMRRAEPLIDQPPSDPSSPAEEQAR
jgi:hypothetical protein